MNLPSSCLSLPVQRSQASTSTPRSTLSLHHLSLEQLKGTGTLGRRFHPTPQLRKMKTKGAHGLPISRGRGWTLGLEVTGPPAAQASFSYKTQSTCNVTRWHFLTEKEKNSLDLHEYISFPLLSLRLLAHNFWKRERRGNKESPQAYNNWTEYRFKSVFRHCFTLHKDTGENEC